MPDWDDVVGEGREGSTVGPFGLGRRNARGDTLVDFCTRNLCIMNTWFEHHLRKRYTWKAPGDIRKQQIISWLNIDVEIV